MVSFKSAGPPHNYNFGRPLQDSSSMKWLTFEIPTLIQNGML